MKTRIVRIGNSQGIRIPKPLLEQLGLEGDVQLDVQGDSLVIRPSRKPREGWAESFRAMAEHGDDAPLLPDHPLTTWDEDEWAWE
jgi:antitoxin MazE